MDLEKIITIILILYAFVCIYWFTPLKSKY